jgi:hypothetical protein
MKHATSTVKTMLLFNDSIVALQSFKAKVRDEKTPLFTQFS